MTVFDRPFNRPVMTGRNLRRRLLAWLAVVLVASTLLADPARAHKVSIFAWVENGTVYTESKFSGGRAPKDSPVIVYDLSGKKLLDGVTDDDGRFSFPAPKAPGIKIALSAGQGHLAEWTVSAEELAEAMGATPLTPETKPSPVKESGAANADSPGQPAALAATDGPTIDDIRRAVGEPIASELQALRGEVRRLRQEMDPGPGVTDILGGIGYIIGLVGIGAYFKNRSTPTGGVRRDS
jgi:nickel transport protein